MLQQFSKIFLVLFIFAGVFFSCTKDDEPTPTTDPNPTDTTTVGDTTTTGDTTTNDTTDTPDPEPEPEPTAITIIGSDFARYEGVGSEFTAKGILLSQVEVPTEGENQLWDISSYNASNIAYFQHDRLPVPDNTSFPSATYITIIPSEFNEALTIKSFYEVSDEGFLRLGGVVNPDTLNLGGGTTLTASGEEIVYEDKIYDFPMNYGDMVDNNWVLEENYSLTAPAFGLSNAPVSRKLTKEGKIEIVGWGKIVLPQGAITDSVEVLLVKDTRKTVLNYFLDGSTAPAALTGALGLTEGETENSISYVFISKEFGRVLQLDFDMRSNGTPITPARTAYYMTSKTE
ncbi:hypothetical protein ACE193_04825 [Bernardetia sp. OM2101]|uniref:hypothetical protein n=1 Tax=Bernardetia sp. OM2101 TaxID=3344876 RepID=UPI0035D10C82